MKTNVLLIALSLLLPMSSCAQSQKATKNDSVNQETKVVRIDGDSVSIIRTSNSTKGSRSIATQITSNGKGKTFYVLKSDGEGTYSMSFSDVEKISNALTGLKDSIGHHYKKIEADLKADLPKLNAEEMPEYPGGASAMMNFIMDKIKYPEDAKKAGKEGRVVCSFVIDKEGNVTDAHVVQSCGTQSLDEAAVLIVKQMPQWKPGKDKGKPVRVQYVIPITFSLK